MAYLSDDGTMDTVITCGRCGRENRFTYEPFTDDDIDGASYDAFVDECIASVDEDCLHCGDGTRMEEL